MEKNRKTWSTSKQEINRNPVTPANKMQLKTNEGFSRDVMNSIRVKHGCPPPLTLFSLWIDQLNEFI
mgnify:FL=1